MCIVFSHCLSEDTDSAGVCLSSDKISIHVEGASPFLWVCMCIKDTDKVLIMYFQSIRVPKGCVCVLFLFFWEVGVQVGVF